MGRRNYKRNRNLYFYGVLAKLEKGLGAFLFFISFGVIPLKGLAWGLGTMVLSGIFYFHGGAKEYDYERSGGHIIYSR